MNISVAIRGCLLTLAVALVAVAGQNPAPKQQAAKLKQPVAASNANESAEGEKRFETHCGRCHVTPEDLSPREAKAVLRQMRVRANLSAEDQRLILKYLAP